MPRAQLSESEKQTLETLIDSNTLAAVLVALSEICGEKAHHLRSNWQDDKTANAWARASSSLDRWSFIATIRNISE